MNTKMLMSASALVMGLAGMICTFLPHELLQYMQAPPVEPLAYLVQITGALYLSFAMLNWMAKTKLIGGIYSRPVTVANFLHFTMGALLFGKGLISMPASEALWVACLFYTGFAIPFGLVLFRHPLKQAQMNLL